MGNVRSDYLKDGSKVLVNVNTLKGQVFRNGAEVTQPDSLAKYLQEGMTGSMICTGPSK
jgi:hypothetical protein